MVPSGSTQPRWRETVSWSAVSREVPRSPDGHLDHFGAVGHVDVRRRQVQADGFLDVSSCLILGIARRSATGKLGTDRRVRARFGIEFEDHAKLHTPSIVREFGQGAERRNGSRRQNRSVAVTLAEKHQRRWIMAAAEAP
jgi:hypothetical protein